MENYLFYHLSNGKIYMVLFVKLYFRSKSLICHFILDIIENNIATVSSMDLFHQYLFCIHSVLFNRTEV